MRRTLILILALLLVACQALVPLAAGTSTPTVPVATSTETIPPSPPPSASPSPFPSPPPTQNPGTGFSIRYHPDGGLYVSDLVSIEVIAPPGLDLKDKKVHARVASPVEVDLGEVGFGAYGIGGRSQATFLWVWNTQGLEPGVYRLTYSIDPEGASWSDTVTLRPESQLPPPQPQAHWESATSNCCVIHYITGTAAARDIQTLLSVADAQAADVESKLGATFKDPIQITLLPRVLGQGGFAGSEIDISYLDRNYAGSDFALVLHHEMVHILDGQLGGELRPSMLVEGLAVYLSGGHFKPEPILPRAAALLKLGWYIPLGSLADDFYQSQHETGYLESAALIQFMVNRWGWQAFSDFYRDIHPDPSGKQSLAIDTALKKHYQLSFAQLEQLYLKELRSYSPNPDMISDVRLSVEYFDTARRYQQLLDPSAYFLSVWLPGGEEMRKRGIVADYLRHPQGPENIALENMLVRAQSDLVNGDYDQVNKTLADVNLVLDMVAAGYRQLESPEFFFGNKIPAPPVFIKGR